jgi:ribosomal protein S18 acetylase RimI-like enzyme
VSDIEIRLSSPDEYEAIGELTAAAYEHDYDDLPDHYRADLHDVATKAAQGQVWVALDSGTGELLGTVATALPGQPLTFIGRDRELDFRVLAVSPTARRRGIGRLLVEHIIDLARERGDVAVVLATGKQMVKAQQLYESLGFQRQLDREDKLPEDYRKLLYLYGLDVRLRDSDAE